MDSGGGDTVSMSSSTASTMSRDLVLVRIGVPELNVEKCLQYQKDEVIWEVKQQALAALPKELEECFNYGLFLPPSHGKAGKFLDEERRLSEYPFSGPIGYLELKYKRRVYKMLQMDEKALKAINSKASRKKFMDHVTNNNVEKVTKMCAKGLDPNYHCQDSGGETPLSLAVGLKSSRTACSKMLIALVNGGGIVDFRNRADGSTAVHKAVIKNNIEALQTLLDLGASPNYKDLKGLTPLYYCVSNSSDVVCVELLLHDRALVGSTDLQGWQEVHQACRNGLVAHLEQLLSYGAELNARNASGNTPIHVCAVNNQESCIRTLLFRGADKEALNYAGQTAYQVAVIAGNLDLAEVIQRHRRDDVVAFKETPKFNPRRRTSTSTSFSSPRQPQPHLQPQTCRHESPIVNILHLRGGEKPPSSPSPSDRSLPPFSSGSSISETTSTGSGSSSLLQTVVPPNQVINSKNRNSLLHQSLHNKNLIILEDEHLDSASALAVSIANDSLVESESLSSGVGTSSHSGSAGSSTTPIESHPPSLILPGMHVVCLENFSNPNHPNGLHITQGEIIEGKQNSFFPQQL
jgi:SH3/ankyrin repeat-containing protein